MLVAEFTRIATEACYRHEGHVQIVVTAVRPSPHGPLVEWSGGSPLPRSDDGRTRGWPAAQDVCSVLARVLACRWREGRAVVPRDWRAQLGARHPGVFEPAGPYTYGGWRWLWEAGAELVGETGARGFRTTQTKEKFALARWYYSTAPSNPKSKQLAVREVVDCIEHLSAYICEYCGAPGRVRAGGWAQTCCDFHAVKSNREEPR